MSRLLWLGLMAGSASWAGPIDGAFDAVAGLSDADRQAVVDRLFHEGLVELPGPAASPVADAADARALASTVEFRLDRARAAMRAGAPDQAVSVLRPVTADPRVAPFWSEAVDAHVYAERERAGRMVRNAARFSPETRAAELRGARDVLVTLAEDFPESVYAEPVLDALLRVDRLLDGLTP